MAGCERVLGQTNAQLVQIHFTNPDCAMSKRRDIPERIAKWLFYIGCVWAFILVPCLIIAAVGVPFGLASLDLRPLLLVLYIVA